jgi:hypothetical protein
VIGGASRTVGAPVREWHPIQRHDFKNLSIKLQIQIAVGRGVHDTPELPLFWPDLDSRANDSIHSKDFFNSPHFCATSLGWDFNLVPQFGRIWIMLNGTAAHNHHALTKAAHLWSIPFHPFDDDGS